MNAYTTTILSEFNTLQGEVSGALATKREVAALSIPTELPPENWTPDAELDHPLSGTPAESARVLVPNLVNAVLPTNGTGIFTIRIADAIDPRLKVIAASLGNQLAAEAMTVLNASNLRALLHDALRALVVVGDACVEQVNERRFVMHKVDNFVVHRMKDGRIYRLIVREWVDWKTLPGNYLIGDAPSISIGTRRMEPLFTELKWNDVSKRYDKRVEFRNHIVERGEVEVINYYPLRARQQIGSDIGVSIFEDIIGTLQGLQCAELALLEGLASNSEFRILVNPTGLTQVEDVQDSRNGQIMSGRGEDVNVTGLGNAVQVQLAQAAVEKYERAVRSACSYGRAYASSNRDRVTAAEVQVDAKEREGGVSGVLTNLSSELLIPMIFRTIFLLREKIKDPIMLGFVADILKDPDMVQLATGVAALHLEIRGLRLSEVVNTLVRLPEPAWADIDWSKVTQELFNSAGFVGSEFLKTPEQKQAEQQQQMAATAGNAAAQTMGESVLDSQQVPPQAQPAM
jgi:hypothetical protein